MNISLENYKSVFDEFSNHLDVTKYNDEKAIQSIIQSLKSKLDELYSGGKQLEQQNDILKIGVVGQVKAGKSSFLNSLFFDGESVLPRASTPMTAGLTVLRYGEENKFDIEYYNTNEWKLFSDKDAEYNSLLNELRQNDPTATDAELIKRYNIPDDIVSAHELISKCSRRALGKIKPEATVESKVFSGIKDLQSTLDNYVGADGAYTPITKCLTITLKDDRLKGIEVVDTPGVNDPVLSRELRTREFLRGCHGVFFLSYSGRFFDSTDVGFLTNRIGSQGIGSVVLIASKFDSVLQDVGMHFRDDLGNAIEDCQKKLKGQYQNNISSSSFTGTDPILDFSSGIGYSIFKKDLHNLDEMESHVVAQMKSFYPSFFSSDEDIKSTFYDLSQIDSIRDSYLDGVFKKNKFNIIKDKINKYFDNASSSIKEIISKEQKKLSELIELIENSDIKDLEKQKEISSKVIREIYSDVNSIAHRSQDVAERRMKECLNGFSFSWNGTVPTNEATTSLVRISKILGKDKTFSCSYKKVDLCKLEEDIDKQLCSALEGLNKEWSESNKEIYDTILKCIINLISKNESEDTTGYFSGKILRNELDEIIDRMRNYSTLDIAGVKNRFHNGLVSSLTGADTLNYQKTQCDEAIAINNVQEAATKCADDIRVIVNQQVCAVQDEVVELLKKAKEESLSILRDRKDFFINEISEKVNKKLDELVEALAKKTQTLSSAKCAQNTLKSLEAKL